MRPAIDHIYTSKDLIRMYGGNFQYSMPTVHGFVKYCKFDPKINPLLPNEAWIEQGPIRRKCALSLINQKQKKLIFTKIQKNQWRFIGYAQILNGTTKKKIEKINLNPPRHDVEFILILHYS